MSNGFRRRRAKFDFADTRIPKFNLGTREEKCRLGTRGRRRRGILPRSYCARIWINAERGWKPLLRFALFALAAGFHLNALADVVPASPDKAPAAISLYNPTQWDGALPVEIPTGRIASPGLIDWKKVHLQSDGEIIPFAIREGRAHWRATLEAPLKGVLAEDLLVFSCAIPPGAWLRIEVRQGAAESPTALTKDEKRILVSYPSANAAFDSSTGALLEFTARGESLLKAPFLPVMHRLGEKGYDFSGEFASGYQTPAIEMDLGDALPGSARLLSSSSNAAMTELHFLLEPSAGPALALTYRLHASGVLEIALDERPWTGTSPWLNHAVQAPLAWEDAGEPLPYLESRMPFYGFKEYEASTREVARIHRGNAVNTLELEDQALNGRHFYRRLAAVPAENAARMKDLAEAMDEGFVIEVTPVCATVEQGSVRMVSADASNAAAVKMVAEALKSAGVDLSEASDAPPSFAVEFVAAAEDGLHNAFGDGFAITPTDKNGAVVHAHTRLGAYNAAQAVARHLRRFGKEGGIPLIARTPVVQLRAGGFGGGNVEVDFPYGTEDEWHRAFDGLLDSGMNVFGCLGMWGNWKMPVAYKYMPELRSEAPDAYDESSGAKFTELDQHREHGLRLMEYLHDRGAQVWLWIPIGCVPTTYAKAHPEAMAPGSDKVPCPTHPEYARYIEAFFKELLETYPIDGLFLIRDDNGGKCACDRCKEYYAKTRTKNPIWEQYLTIYDLLRNRGFKGGMAVYPYNDMYKPELDPLLPEDLYVVGHGSGAAVLARNYNRAAPMGDTWLDNLYANFRVAPSPRMKRLLCDRPSFWIGGAYCGTELPWESVGYFGWEPTATPNSLRYAWGMREFGATGALPFVQTNRACERLWDINALPMLPGNWMKLSPEQRQEVMKDGTNAVEQFRARLADLKQVTVPEDHARWYGHVDLFASYIEYHLHRLDKFAAIYERVCANRGALDKPEGLPKEVRDVILADYAEMYVWAAKYDAVMQKAPGDMLAASKWMVKPYREFMAGYDQWLDNQLDPHQFVGTAQVETLPALKCSEPFTLRIELHNKGVCPWVAEAGHRMEFSAAASEVGLAEQWDFTGEPVAPGDRRMLEFKGVAPKDAGTGEVSFAFVSPYRVPEQFIKGSVKLEWK